MSYVIHSYPNNPYVFKSLIAAEFGGIKIDYPSDFKMGEDNKTSEFKSKNPNGQVPILDSPDGYDLICVCTYELGLYGKAMLSFAISPEREIKDF